MNEAPLLILIGVAGAGKTTVGRILADRYGLQLIEADDLVGETAGVPIGELIIGADPRLEDLRRRAARTALATPGAIVTLGASQPSDEDTRDALERARLLGARVVELYADTAEVARREGLNRPRSVGLGAPRAMLSHMIAQLHELYGAVADSSADTRGRTPVDVAIELARECRLAGDSIQQE
ncbi:shikimate kinase [Actinomyces mediterranea]|uniref:shikimate kinase n=1 Tax=Actinomyces mediterranea TaxID=1871028 RepID=UPI000970CF45|nr:shikimate kinase [Actinomyces mediterranea]